MKTNIEKLPFEVWLIIFQYLEAHDIFGAFQNWNSHFDRILDSNQLSLYVRLEETDNNDLENSNNPYWSDSVLNCIKCLRTTIQSQSTYFIEFLRCHADKLIQLQRLSIKTPQQGISSIPYLCQYLKGLNRLEYLSMSCGSYGTIYYILDAILALPVLRICRLIIEESPLSIHDVPPLHINNSIQQVFIVFLKGIDDSLVHSLLSHTPELRRLEISGSSLRSNPVSLFSKLSFTLPELRILKLRLQGGDITHDCFECLHTTLPALKYFYFHYTKHILPEMFLDVFVTRWLPIIEPIQSFDIHIKVYQPHNGISRSTLHELKNNLEILSDKVRQLNQDLKFKWKRQSGVHSTIIEITIAK